MDTDPRLVSCDAFNPSLNGAIACNLVQTSQQQGAFVIRRSESVAADLTITA